MESKYGVKGTIHEQVFFTESRISGASILKHIEVQISKQNSNLGEVKTAMAREAKATGGNVIMNFQYGQRAHKGFQLISIKWDTESWFGEGDAISV